MAKKGVIYNVIDGSILTKNEVLRHFPFLLYLAFLMVLYIAHGYRAERLIRDLNQAENALKELKARHVTISSNLEMIRQQSKVAEAVRPFGLEESTVPPIQLYKK